ncbi:MAG: FhaA domain-containing protein [Moorellaceae bacterium]
MGWLESMESLGRRFFEGLFRRDKEDRLQPVEIAKKLYQVMLAHRSVSVNRVYVPNVYLVYLPPRDYENLSMYRKALAEELAAYLRERVEAKNYTLVGNLRVEWELDEELPPGELRIHARLEEEWPAEGQEDTLIYPALRNGSRSGKQAPEVCLVVIEGPDQGRSFLLHPGRQVLGRNPACEIVLTDEQVSRQHCLVEVEEDKIIVVDLGSRNGTSVNGEPIKRVLLAPGDRLQLGRTVLEVQVV